MDNLSESQLQAIVLAAIIVVPCVILGVVVQCLYLCTLAGVLRECSKQNRAMRPRLVWLNLIPYFSTVWMFVTVNRVADSLKAECRARGFLTGDDYGRKVGLWSLVLGFLGVIPYVGWLAVVVSFVLWIVHWCKMSEYRKALATGSRYAPLMPRRQPAYS